MGASLQPSSRRSRRKRGRTTPEINVTPFVDVMLVLLIIFMVAAPMLMVNVPVNLPSAEGPPSPTKPKLVTITLQENGKVFIQDIEIDKSEMVAKLEAIIENKDKDIVVVDSDFRGDKNVSYAQAAEVFTILYRAGFKGVTVALLPNEMTPF